MTNAKRKANSMKLTFFKADKFSKPHLLILRVVCFELLIPLCVCAPGGGLAPCLPLSIYAHGETMT